MAYTLQNNWEVIRIHEGTMKRDAEEVAVEYPLTVMLNGEEFATMVCSPTDLRELLIGFLASEGMIRSMDEVKSLKIDEQQGFAYVELYKQLAKEQHDHSKRFIGSCCGKSRQFYFKSDVKTAKTVRSKLKLTVSQGFALMNELQQESENFLRTGGVHNAALCTPEKMLAIRTDIGRHNALDKIYGSILVNKTPLSDKVIVFSGRISSEVLLKVSKIGVGIIISKSAPTDLALKLADDLGITAVGFVRGSKMNIYTHPQRIADTAK
jgi:FdhD protein